MVNQDTPDRLPPHSLEAERGVLACVLASPIEIETAVRQVTEPEMFYDLGHRTIWLAMTGLHEAGTAVDVITLYQRLKDHGNLGTIDLAYLSALQDATPSAANITYYLEILRDKFVLRRLVRTCTEAVSTVYTWEGTVETVLSKVTQELDALGRASQDPNRVPVELQTPRDFAEDLYNAWFGADATEPGLLLPEGAFGAFPFKQRLGELTLFLGEKGMGKSTLLSYVLLHLAAHGWKIFIASFETHRRATGKMLMRQLLGRGELPDSPSGHALFRAALAWIEKRFVIYNFRGIAPWRTVLAHLDYAVSHMGVQVAAIDSFMRLGILDDDYAQQGQCMIHFANFCETRGINLWMANHLNKSDGSAKDRSRGSQQIKDNAHNVSSVKRNEKKKFKLDELWQQRRSGDLTEEKWLAAKKDLDSQPDGQFDLHNQRWAGSQQNGRRYLWFEPASLQFSDQPNQPPVNWLERWTKDEQPA